MRTPIFCIKIFALLFLASCTTTPVEPPIAENVCTLTKDKIPEVRGFRLGMPLSEVVKRFPRICKFDGEIKYPAGRISLTKSKSEIWQNDRECNDVAGREKLSTFNESEYPELSGVSSLNLEFSHHGLTSLKIRYEDSESEDFAQRFNQKIREQLGLEQWTNWKTLKKDSLNSERDLRTETELNQLLCNKVEFETQLESWELLRIPNDANVDRARAEARLGKKSHSASLTVAETDKVALSSSDNQRLRQRAEEEQRNKVLEDEKKAETFKP